MRRVPMYVACRRFVNSQPKGWRRRRPRFARSTNARFARHIRLTTHRNLTELKHALLVDTMKAVIGVGRRATPSGGLCVAARVLRVASPTVDITAALRLRPTPDAQTLPKASLRRVGPCPFRRRVVASSPAFGRQRPNRSATCRPSTFAFAVGRSCRLRPIGLGRARWYSTRG